MNNAARTPNVGVGAGGNVPYWISRVTMFATC